MAITINLTNIVVDLTSSIGTITDGSTYTSPVRTGCGVFVKVYKTDYSGAKVALTTTPNNTDPGSASTVSWTYTHSSDGWYKIAYVAAPNYAGGTTYAKYDAVYDTSSKNLYRSKAAGNLGNALSNTTWWEVISDPTSIAFNIGTATESVNLTTITSQTVYNIILFPITTKNFGTQAGQAFLEASSDYKRSHDVRVWEMLALAVDACTIANNRQQYANGENYCRRAAYIIANDL